MITYKGTEYRTLAEDLRDLAELRHEVMRVRMSGDHEKADQMEADITRLFTPA